MAMRASTFQSFLQYITDHCKPVLPGEAISVSGDADDRPRVALTFDDGWKDNFETAFPVAQEYRVPFTVFVCPQMIDCQTGFWTTTLNNLWWTAQDAGKLDLIYKLVEERVNGSAASLIANLKRMNAEDREQVIVKLQAALAPYIRKTESTHDQLLTWKEVKEMANAGIVFGSHTNTHPILTDISQSEAAKELSESRSRIAAELRTCSWFAYPNGDWSQSVRQLVAQSGYQAAFANFPGIWEANSDRFSIPRNNLWEGSLAGFRGRFSRIALEYAIFWKAWRA